MAEQAADHGLLAMGAAPDHEGEFGVGPQLDQTELADLGEGPVATRPGRGPAEGGDVGVGVRDVVLPRQQRRSHTNPKRERGSDEIK